MRTLEKLGIFMVVSLVLVTPVQAQLFKKSLKIGYVDIAKAFDEYEATDKATEELKKEIQEKRKDIDKRTETINLLKQKLETQGTVITEEEKAKMEEEVEAKIKELKETAERSNIELRQKEQKFVRDILKNIEEVVKAYGRDNDYDLILDKREVLYGPEGMDITGEIVKVMNKRAKEKK